MSVNSSKFQFIANGNILQKDLIDFFKLKERIHDPAKQPRWNLWNYSYFYAVLNDFLNYLYGL